MSHRPRVCVSLVLAVLAVYVLAAIALGADPFPSPSSSPAELPVGGDLRSDGEGPGLVGNPLLILGAVVLLGLATAALTVVLVRVTARD